MKLGLLLGQLEVRLLANEVYDLKMVFPFDVQFHCSSYFIFLLWYSDSKELSELVQKIFARKTATVTKIHT